MCLIKETKLSIQPIFLNKNSWKLSKKEKCNDIKHNSKCKFKERNFLELSHVNGNLIISSYSKGGAWVKHVGHSNFLCIQILS